MISYGLWQQRFGGNDSVIGRTLDFGHGQPYTIVGVAPKGFTGVDIGKIDVWLPLHTALVQMGEEFWLDSEDSYFLRTVARLASGATSRQAEAEATVVHRQGRQRMIHESDYDPEAKVLLASLIPGRGPEAPDEAAVAKWLLGISLVVLLIACANIANLLLARAVRQRGEIAVRLALGSSRGRVVGQVLTESLLLALLGGLAALLLARLGGDFLRGILLPNISWTYPGAPERVAGVVLALTLIAGIFAGLLPSLQTSRPDLAKTLKSGARSTSTPGSRTRDLLTITQAALSVVLLVGAGLFVRSLQQVQSLDLGINPEGVLLITPSFEENASEGVTDEFVARATERLRALPDFSVATTARGVPFRSGSGYSVSVPGLDSIPNLPGGGPYVQVVDSGYFGTLDLQIRRGRGFTTADRPGTPPVAVVSETMARTLWPGQDPLGKCFILKGEEEGPCPEVVGVVENARRFRLIEDDAMQFYLPLQQEILDTGSGTLLVRAPGDAKRFIPILQRELLALEPRLRFVNVEPLQEILDPQARSWRLGATMFTVFGLLALTVAAVGLYSVLAFVVAQRTFELGVRSALGATRQRLMGLVFGQAMRLVGIGVILGLLAALLLAPKVEPLLFETSPRDPLVLAGVVAMLLIIAALAASLPAWSATRVDPSVALRAE